MRINCTATVFRLEQIEGGTLREWEEVGDVQLFLAPTGGETRALAGDYGILGEAFDAHGKSTLDIRPADKLEIDEDSYIVRGVRNFSGSSTVDNLQLILEKEEE